MKINQTILNTHEKYIVGVSGGVDSMALLDTLQKLGYRIAVCHVNYHLRHDSNQDQQIVENYCEKHQIPCYCREVVSEEYQTENFQMQARNIRYAFYQEIGKQRETDNVILGHHWDDVIETIYMQIERKTTKGFLGIQEKSRVLGMTVYRPLLAIKKTEIYAYCQQYQIPYHEDYTNFETNFTRDYVRNVALKKYTREQKEEMLKQVLTHNKRYQKQQKQIASYMKRYLSQQYIAYQTIPEDTIEAVVYQMIKKDVYPPYISNTLVEEVVKQIHSTKPNVEVALPLNTVFIKEYDNIYVSKNKSNKGYCLKYSQLVYDKHDYFYLAKVGHENEGVYIQDKDFPLTIRTYRSGDVMITSGGTKKISRLFIDKKIPRRLRQVWPIIERSDGTIILVPNIAKNIGYLYTKPNVFVIKYKDLEE